MSPLIEAALRSLLLAAAVAAGLRLFRIRNVVAQKAAWTLVLLSAIAMPFFAPLAARWQFLPDRATLAVPQHPLAAIRALWPHQASVVASTPAPAEHQYATQPIIIQPVAPHTAKPHATKRTEESPGRETTAAPSSQSPSLESTVLIASVDTPPPALTHTHPTQSFPTPHLAPARIALYAYALVVLILLARLAAGLFAALEILFSANPIDTAELPAFAHGLRLRVSPTLAAPVTIASTIVLPADSASWPVEKLRIVLAHEQSHLRQGDFYLQLLASLYTALVWFSPLGWWLRRHLSDLAEAISDRAGLAHAPSRSAYARLLLEFAATPRPTPIGVAMARPHRLTRRIENLLHESRFAQAFAGGRRSFVAVALVPLALLLATSFVRVQAAGQQAPIPPAAPSAVPAPVAAPAAEPAPVAEPSVVPEPAPAPEPAPVPEPPDTEGSSHTVSINNGSSVYMSNSNGESYALITGNGNFLVGTGMLNSHTNPGINQARKLAHGDFLWFTRGGKSYYIDDPATIARLRSSYEAMEALGRRQSDLGKHQSEFGRQQEDFARSQEEFARQMANFKIDESQLKVTVPDLTKQKAELDAALAELQPLAGKTVSREQLAHIQQQLAEMQARLSTLHTEYASHIAEQVSRQLKQSDMQATFSLKQSELGRLQSKLGEEQGRLGAQQGKLAHEADQKVKSIIQQSLQNGSAHPVH